MRHREVGNGRRLFVAKWCVKTLVRRTSVNIFHWSGCGGREPISECLMKPGFEVIRTSADVGWKRKLVTEVSWLDRMSDLWPYRRRWHLILIRRWRGGVNSHVWRCQIYVSLRQRQFISTTLPETWFDLHNLYFYVCIRLYRRFLGMFDF